MNKALSAGDDLDQPSSVLTKVRRDEAFLRCFTLGRATPAVLRHEMTMRLHDGHYLKHRD